MQTKETARGLPVMETMLYVEDGMVKLLIKDWILNNHFGKHGYTTTHSKITGIKKDKPLTMGRTKGSCYMIEDEYLGDRVAPEGKTWILNTWLWAKEGFCYDIFLKDKGFFDCFNTTDLDELIKARGQD